MHHHRHEEVSRVLDTRPREARRPDADDGKRSAVQFDGAPDNRRIGAESPAPRVVTEDDDRVGPGHTILFVPEEPSA